jgi:mannose-1-phosphate guanylyltransferase
LYAVVLAGGAGQRLWPLSRRNSPKQFTPLIASKSSIQLAVERISRLVDPTQIFVGTNRDYAILLRDQLPGIPQRNYILEPTRRDVAAAVGLAFFSLEKDGVTGPVIFQWSDHYVRESATLVGLFTAGRELIESRAAGLVIIAQEPGFANDNLGWIKLQEPKKLSSGQGDYYPFSEWVYRPTKQRCEEMFQSRGWVWNTGHFVTSVEFMTGSFRLRAPALAAALEKIVSYRGTAEAEAKLAELYPKLESNSFDDVILRNIPRDEAFVLKADLGWTDPGNLNALKEALQESPDANVIRGGGVCLDTRDVFVHNTTDRPVVVMGASDLRIIEMPDVTLVINKNSVRDLGTLLAELKRLGFDSLL